MQNKNAVIIWSEGFPVKKNAINEKNSLIAKALILSDYDVYLTSKSFFSEEYRNGGELDQIRYRNFSCHRNTPHILNYVNAIFNEMRFLISLKKKYNNIYLIGSYSPIIIFFLYSIFSKISRVKFVLSIMEWHIAAHKELPFHKRINAFLFDNYAVLLSSGVIAISELIISNLSKISPRSKYVLLPALTDCQKIYEIHNSAPPDFPYILYCGGVGYSEVIELILDSFEGLCKGENNLGIHLIMVLHGNQKNYESLITKIKARTNFEKVHIFNDLDYTDLIKKYKNATALLVPLRNTVQDIARYPQKIAEYAACGRPVISNKIGQVGTDFLHKRDIYFANSFISADLENAISEILKDKKMAEIISINARKKAENYFDYRHYSIKLGQFLKNL